MSTIKEKLQRFDSSWKMSLIIIEFLSYPIKFIKLIKVKENNDNNFNIFLYIFFL